MVFALSYTLWEYQVFITRNNPIIEGFLPILEKYLLNNEYYRVSQKFSWYQLYYKLLNLKDHHWAAESRTGYSADKSNFLYFANIL